VEIKDTWQRNAGLRIREIRTDQLQGSLLRMEHSKDLLHKDSISKDLISKDSLRKDSYHRDLFHRHSSFKGLFQTVKTNPALFPIDRFQTDLFPTDSFLTDSLRTDRFKMDRINRINRISSRLNSKLRLRRTTFVRFTRSIQRLVSKSTSKVRSSALWLTLEVTFP